MSLLVQGIPPVQVIQEAFDLTHALVVCLRESPLEEGLRRLECLWPEDHASHDQEGGADGTRQQDSSDTRDHQEGTHFLGQGPDSLDFPSIIEGFGRTGDSRLSPAVLFSARTFTSELSIVIILVRHAIARNRPAPAHGAGLRSD